MTEELTLAALHRLVPAAEEEDILDELRTERSEQELIRLRDLREEPEVPAPPAEDPPRRTAGETVHDALHLLATELDARLLPRDPD